MYTHLCIRGGVPVRIVDQNAVRACEVHAQAPHLRAHRGLARRCARWMLATRGCAEQCAAGRPIPQRNPLVPGRSRTLVVRRKRDTSGLELKSAMRRARRGTGVEPSIR